MSDKLLEQVSSLLDDELPSQEAELLLARMQRDPALRRRYARYALISEAARGRTLAVDLAARVSVALEDVPAHQPKSARLDRWVSHLRPVAGLAVAASVAMFAVLALSPEPTPAPAEVVPALTPGSQAVLRPQQAGFSGVSSPELQTQLRQYLLNHSEHASSIRLRGVMPYVQIAAHDATVAEQVEDDAEGNPKDAE